MVLRNEVSKRTMLKQAGRLAVAAPFMTLLGCDDAGILAGRESFSGTTMGTYYRITIAGRWQTLELAGLQRAVERALETVNDLMSTYRTTSELSRFNAVKQVSWFEASPQITHVVETALEIGRLSGGAFDTTVGPLVNLWGFGPDRQTVHSRGDQRIEATLTNIGQHHLEVSQSKTAIKKGRTDLYVDLSGIGKGFAVDQIADVLAGAGAGSFLVDIGGDIRVRRRSPTQATWRIGIEQPAAGPRKVHRVISIGDGAVATSGDYRNFFEAGGSRFSHIIDPRTGAPIKNRLASVTVIAPTTEEADGWSTALMVLGPKSGLELAEQLGLAAFFIIRKGNGLVDRATSEFRRFLVA